MIRDEGGASGRSDTTAENQSHSTVQPAETAHGILRHPAHDMSNLSAGPKRVQLSRRKGWRMPPNTVKVDRSTKWGNPFVIGGGPMGRHALDLEGCVGFFRQMLGDDELRKAADYPDDLSPLRGKNLACWCAGKHCHADVLLELANSPLIDVEEE